MKRTLLFTALIGLSFSALAQVAPTSPVVPLPPTGSLTVCQPGQTMDCTPKLVIPPNNPVPPAINNTVNNYYTFNQNDARVNRVGAIGAALNNASASLAGVQTRNLVGMGVGSMADQRATAFIYQHRNLDGHSAWNASLAFGEAGQKSVGLGYAIGW